MVLRSLPSLWVGVLKLNGGSELDIIVKEFADTHNTSMVAAQKEVLRDMPSCLAAF